MTKKNKVNLDSIDWKIIKALQINARIPLSSLSKKVGLSSPALSERLKKLEENGAIEGYHARVNYKVLGYDVMAMLRVRVAGENIKKTLAEFDKNPHVIECHRVTGEDCYIVKLVVPSLEHLDKAVVKLANLADIITSIVLASPVEGKPIGPPRNTKHFK